MPKNTNKNSNLIDFKKVKTTWDLSTYYKGVNDLKISADKTVVKENINIFVKKWKNNKNFLKSPNILKKALSDYEHLIKTTSTGGFFGLYAFLNSELDTNNSEFKALNANINTFETEQENKISFFEHKISKIKNTKPFLTSPALKEYRHYLELLFKQGKYLLSEKEENLLNLVHKSSVTNWVLMTQEFLNKYNKKTLNEEGVFVKKTFEETLSLLSSTNKKVRKMAAKKVYTHLKKLAPIAEHELNSVLYTKKIVDKLRGIKDPDTTRYLSDDIDKKVVQSMVKSLTNSYEISQRYYQFKAKIFNVKKLEVYERNVPYHLKKVEPKISFKKSVNLVSTVFNNLDPDFLKILQDMFYNGRVDVFPKVAKVGGAYCLHSNLSQPNYILLNHTNRLQDVRTLAHEFGHCINNYLMKNNVNSLNYSTSLATAEVASTFFEDFVYDELLKSVNKEEKLGLLMGRVEDILNTTFRQISFFNFEQKLHKLYYQKNYLTHKDISKLFLEESKKQLGNCFNYTKNFENSWVYVSHFRRFFYVYTYASGVLISKYMQQKYKEDKKFIKNIKEFLQTGTTLSPKETFLNMGIDITIEDFWDKGIKNIDNMIREVINLAGDLKKI